MSKYYDPNGLFSSNLSQLAPEFANNRYDRLQDLEGNINVTRNSSLPGINFATAEIYGPNDFRIPPYSARSQILPKYRGTNYGHSEPYLMLDRLGEMYAQDNLNPHDNLNPSLTHNLRSLNSNEPLATLVRNPNLHKTYLQEAGRKVNMLSERPFCQIGETGGCSQFMQSIAPRGSIFGHTVQYNQGDSDNLAVNRAIDTLGPAYLNYLRETNAQHPQTLPNTRRSAFSNSSTVSFPTSIVNEYPSSSPMSSIFSLPPTSSSSSMSSQVSGVQRHNAPQPLPSFSFSSSSNTPFTRGLGSPLPRSDIPQPIQSSSSSLSSSSMGLGYSGDDFSKPPPAYRSSSIARRPVTRQLPSTSISSSPYSSSSISNQAFGGQRRDTPRPVRSTSQPSFSPSSSSSSSSISATSTGRGLGGILSRSNTPRPAQPSSSSLSSSSMGSTQSTSPVLKRPRTISPHSSPTSSDEEWNQTYNDLQARYPDLFQ